MCMYTVVAPMVGRTWTMDRQDRAVWQIKRGWTAGENCGGANRRTGLGTISHVEVSEGPSAVAGRHSISIVS